MFRNTEKKVNCRGAVSYWENGVLVGKKCTICGNDKTISEFDFHNKKKGTYHPECKECRKQYRKNNAEYINKHNREYMKQYNKENKERYKQWHKENTEWHKQYYQNNKERIKEYDKQKYEVDKENNLKNISNMVEQINPAFKQLNLPVYGYVYMFENVKTGHKYVGQSMLPIKMRYKSNIVQGWIKERLEYDTQKFKEELIEEDFVVTETLDVAFCQYHLNKLEVYYINKYDSCNNGYNNQVGNHNTDDGIEEFTKILQQHNLEFIDNKLMEE